jgi:ABC-type transport system substrate-binding protein
MNFQFGPNNRNPDSLNRFIEYRQAVAYGLDLRQLFDNIGYPLLQPTYGFIQHFTPSASSEPWLEYDHDPVRARELLAMACDKAGQDCDASPPVMVFSTTSNGDFRPRLADGLVEMLGEIGIEVRLELEDSQLFFGETLDNGNWDVGEWAWVGSPGLQGLVSIFGLFDPDGPPTEGANYYRWGTPDSIVRDDAAVEEVRSLLAAIRGSVDHDEILALAGRIEEVLATQVVVIPLNARLVVGAVWADEIAGFQMNSTQASHTWNIEFWHRVDL